MLVSIVIPSRNEIYLTRTIQELLEKARGDIEIIAVLDGYWVEPVNDPRVIYIHKGIAQGMRAGINSAVAIAKGKFIMKIDGHCMVDEGFDLKLQETIEPDWIVIPRRKRLDAVNWCIKDVGKPDVDYEYLSFPDNPNDFGGTGLNGRIWTQKALDKKDIMIDEAPASQGSCWFMHRDYFYKLGLMDEENWGTFWCESQELAFKCILSGGKYITNKNTWYAHLHKGKEIGRGYSLDHSLLIQGRNRAMRYFEGEKVEKNQLYPLSYLIEKFMPMPGWDEQKIKDLKEREAKYWI